MTLVASNKNILLVDDDPMIREMVSDILVREGHTVIEADSGKSAFHRFQKHPKIDLIISDLQMSEGDGLWLVAQIRSSGKKTPFILMTGNTDWTQEKALKQGINELYHKPFSEQSLESLIRSIRILGT